MKNSLFLALMLFVSLLSKAQNKATVSWELSVNTINSYVTNGGINATEQSASADYIIRDYGGIESSQRVYSNGGGLGYWPNESTENPARYCEFSLSPRKGIDFQPTILQFRMGNSGGSANLRANVYYSLDSFASSVLIDTNVVLPSASLKEFNYSLGGDSIIVLNEKSIAVRVYPWLEGGVASGKYFNIRDVKITGTTTGKIIAELPQVQAVAIDKISTQAALFKGKVINDGGVSLDSVGVFISTQSGSNTGSSMLVEAISGNFECKLEGLTAGETYYARSFAANSAGINYSNELVFKTLEQLTIPGVVTTKVSDIRTTSAIAHGLVNFDGGLDVTLTGFCFSTQVSPTVNNTVSIASDGLGVFTAYLPNLSSETIYYVRAYAENAIGIGYGDQIEFITPISSPDIHISVDQSGGGDYLSVQEAFNAIPLNYLGNIFVEIKNGIYNEKVILGKGKINVHLMGENRDSTIIRWDDYSGKVVDGITLGTSTSQTIAIDADDFIAQNITFQNTSQVAQAVALRVKGDRMIFQHCKLLGFQDTYYTWSVGRVYNEDCYIEGTVDFIFGSSIAVFKNCEIRSLRNSPITAAATPQNYKFGYVLMNCKLIADNSISGATLGRPWKEFAQTVFIETEQGKHISPAGWLEWSGTNNHLTAYYAEYNCTGEGFVPESRVSWSHQLTDEQAGTYTIENIFSKQSAQPAYYYDWMPDFERVEILVDTLPIDTIPIDTLPTAYQQKQNYTFNIYPNPCKRSATVSFDLTQSTEVEIAIFTLDGRLLEQLVKGNKEVGKHEIAWNAAHLKSGVYLCRTLLNGQYFSRLLIIENE